MPDAFIYDGLRTPIGRHAGGLAPVRPDDLLAGVIKDLVARSPFKAEQFEDAIIGCTLVHCECHVSGRVTRYDRFHATSHFLSSPVKFATELRYQCSRTVVVRFIEGTAYHQGDNPCHRRHGEHHGEHKHSH